MFSKLRAFWGKIVSLLVTKGAVPPPSPKMPYQPYQEHATNLEYNQLFCDNLALFRPAGKLEGTWKEIFNKDPFINALKTIADDNQVETRVRILAFNVLRNKGVLNPKEVLGVVIEVGTEEGDETIALYKDLKARYINARSKSFAWDNTGNIAGINEKIEGILALSQKIIGKAEPWTEPRQAPPVAGDFRISFLVADGFYVGQGKYGEIQSDPVANALVSLAGELMVALIRIAREAKPVTPTKVPVNSPT